MKRLVSLLLSTVIFALTLVPVTGALNGKSDAEYFDDGSYLVVGLGETDAESEESSEGFFSKIIDFIKRIISLIFKRDAQTVTKTKYVRYYDKKGVILWEVYLTGEFYFDGKSASCNEAVISCEIYDNDWSVVSASADKTGARATGSFKIKQQKLGVALKSIEKIITLECDKNGNFM